LHGRVRHASCNDSSNSRDGAFGNAVGPEVALQSRLLCCGTDRSGTPERHAREFDPLCAFERSRLFQRLHAQISGGEQALSRGAIGMRLIAIDDCLDRLAANRSG
jgi:hypothetical protein